MRPKSAVQLSSVLLLLAVCSTVYCKGSPRRKMSRSRSRTRLSDSKKERSPAAPLWEPDEEEMKEKVDSMKNQFFVKMKKSRSSKGRTRINSLKRNIGAGRVRGTKLVEVDKIGSSEGMKIRSKSRGAIRKLQRDPNVDYVEPLMPITINGCLQQKPAPWNLDRLDQWQGLNRRYTYSLQSGEGAIVYVLDSGVDEHHPEFDGRAKFGASVCEGCSDKDELGHGTHVAGIVGGKTYGVAKKTNIISVKIVDAGGYGTTHDVWKALQWVLKDCRSKGKIGKCVVNISVGGAKSKAVNDAVSETNHLGIPVVVSAGNQAMDACRVSPSSSPGAITVGSTNRQDKMSSFSNYGECIDMFAPGEGIKSATPGEKYDTWSGSSLSAPHVTGAVAVHLAHTGNNRGVRSWLTRTSHHNTIKVTKGSKDVLLSVLCSDSS